MLADNRHYTFYVWRKFFLKHKLAKFLPTPAYLFFGWRCWNDLGMCLLLPVIVFSFLLITDVLMFSCRPKTIAVVETCVRACRLLGPHSVTPGRVRNLKQRNSICFPVLTHVSLQAALLLRSVHYPPLEHEQRKFPTRMPLLGLPSNKLNKMHSNPPSTNGFRCCVHGCQCGNAVHFHAPPIYLGRWIHGAIHVVTRVIRLLRSSGWARIEMSMRLSKLVGDLII